MKKVVFLLYLLVIVMPNAFSQKVYLCEKFTEDGGPIKQGTSWDIKPTGGFVYILFQNGAKIKASQLMMHIDKLEGANYKPFDIRAVTHDPKKNWAILDYKFITEGDYRITFKDHNNKELAKEFCNVTVKNVAPAPPANALTADNTLYYINSKVSVGKGIDEVSGVLSSEGSSFEINKSNGALLYIKVSNDKPLETDQILVYIDRQGPDGQYIAYDTKLYDITPSSENIFFKYTFNEPGDYKVITFNNKGNKGKVFINSQKFTLYSSK